MQTFIPSNLDKELTSKIRLANPPCTIANKQVRLINKLRVSASLLSFYRKFIKPCKFLRLICLYLFNKFYPLYINVVANLIEQKSMRWRKLIALSEYIQKNKCQKFIVYPATDFCIDSKLDIYPLSQSGLVGSGSKKEYSFPEVYIATIPNVSVVGGSELICADNYVIRNDFLDLKNDSTSDEIHGQILVDKKFENVRLVDQRNFSDLILPVAATFLNACSHNYAHWISEVLPKVAVFCRDDRFYDIPIVVDENLHPNLIDSLLMVVGETRTIYILPRRLSLSVKELYVVSSVGYVPFGLRNASANKNFHGVFSQSSLVELKFKLTSSLKHLPKAIYPSKIYLKRTGMRHLINVSELDSLLNQKGFVEVDVNKLSFVQQILLFSNVREIVAPSGAALASAIFCQPGTIVYVLIGIHQDMIYRYWVNILSHLGISVKLILGGQNDVRSDIHSDFAINPTDLIDALDNK